MRLITGSALEGFRLVSFDDDHIPPYAILSHTWTGSEEVRFDEFTADSSHDKAGWSKIVFCSEKAAMDDLKYFWVDTCCIDNSNSFELSEAINSMYRWYRDASKCYVYLSDVALGERASEVVEYSAFQNTWIETFRQTRWFTRGWTLIELLAPRHVEFYSREGHQLGSKILIKEQISSITGVPVGALIGQDLRAFSVEERLSWMKERQTTIKEDQIYSILGLFEVYMPLIYGEGSENAARRLKDEILGYRRYRTGLQSEPIPALSTAIQQPHYYSQLLTTGFRVLTLEPAQIGSNIVGHLRERDLRAPPPFSALSYVWGDESEILPIWINGQKTSIRPNLYFALQRLRHELEKVSLWVDALCINQADAQERTMQVRRMADIYSSASQVYIWLGEEDRPSIAAIKFIPSVNMPNFHWDDFWWEAPEFQAFNNFLTRPWFRRRWIIQEAAFSKSSILVCGSQRIEMAGFSLAISLIRRKLVGVQRSITLFSDKTRVLPLASFGDSPATRLLDITRDVFDKSTPRKRRLTLEGLVQRATFCETSDGRDTIFSLLNLASDANQTASTSITKVLNPNYEDSLLDVFANFVIHCCRSGSLDIICRPWAPVTSSMMPPSNQVDHTLEGFVPSWICSKDRLPLSTGASLLATRRHPETLVGDYNADHGTHPQVQLGTDESGRCNGSLFCKGIILGSICRQSPRMVEGVITDEPLNVLGRHHYPSTPRQADIAEDVWRTLCANRDSNGKMAAGRHGVFIRYLIKRCSLDEKERSHDNLIRPIDPDELMTLGLPTEVEDILHRLQAVTWNRRAFEASHAVDKSVALIGLMPRHAGINDQLCILYGCSVPLVLREHVFDDRSCWELIGEAYIHGCMDGEALDPLHPSAPRPDEYEFEIR